MGTVAMRLVKGAARCGVAAGLVLAAAAQTEAASVLWLEDGNSRVDLCVSSDCNPVGANSWIVDGENRLFQEWFWFRIDSDTPAGQVITDPNQPLDAISAPTTFGGGGTATGGVTYENNVVKATVTYVLEGGAADSDRSTLSELVTFTNKSSSSYVWINLFQYSDFDLCGPGSNDNVEISGGVATQTSATECDGVMAQVFGQDAKYHEAAQQGVTLANLDNDVATLGGTSSVSNVDGTSTFQYLSYALPPQLSPWNTITFSLTKEIAPAVPEPMSMMLLGTGLLAVGRTARRRIKARA